MIILKYDRQVEYRQDIEFIEYERNIHEVDLTKLKPGNIVVFTDWCQKVYMITRNRGLRYLNIYRCFTKGYY